MSWASRRLKHPGDPPKGKPSPTPSLLDTRGVSELDAEWVDRALPFRSMGEGSRRSAGPSPERLPPPAAGGVAASPL